MSAIYVLVADKYRARIFEAKDRKGKLREMQTILCPEARFFSRDLGTDTPSSALNSSADHTGQGKHRTGDKTDIKNHQSIEFAINIVDQLHQSQIKNKFSSLILIAPPKFLGTLREKLDDNLRNYISYEMDKELTNLSADEIRYHLPRVLPISDMSEKHMR